LIASRASSDNEFEAEAAAGSFAAFQKRLQDSAGKSVTVVVQEAEGTNVFKFIVK